MKKYFVFLGIAALTLAACSKTEIDETVIPEQKIEFNIANYSTQTRAGETALQNEPGLYTSPDKAYFKTIAKFFPTIGEPQIYMNGVEVLWKNTEWSPKRDYYWPKTGYINFYSYVSSKAALEPAINIDSNNPTQTVTATYSEKTIGENDNILLADAALNQTSNSKKYTDISKVDEGVPTLFHHLLSKVKFTVKLETTEQKKAANTKFVVTILNDESVKDKENNKVGLTNLVTSNVGTYTVTNTYDATSNTKAWSEAKVWTPKDGATETIAPTKATDGTDTAPLALTLAKNTTSTDAVDLIAERTVLPHTLSATDVFTIAYKIEVYYDGTDATPEDKATPYLTEILNFSKPLTGFASAVTAWNINTKYTYAITIDPVGNKIKFDPAVEAWSLAAGGSYSLPE
jgi:hypothetical protein